MARPYRGPVTYRGLILIPVLITLVVTIVRLIGELAHGPAWLFGREAGGGGALIGISWLVPIFAIYFAVKLVNRGNGPSSFSRAIVWFLVALIVTVALASVPTLLGWEQTEVRTLLAVAVASIIGIMVASRGWSFLYRPLLVYAFAARIPVVIIMLIAMIGDWGTHYDAAPPGFPEMGVISKWIVIGLIPQMTIWIAYTVIIGGIVGGIVGGIMTLLKRKPESSPAAT